MERPPNKLKRENIVKYWKANIGDKEINVSWKNALTHCWACGVKTALEKAHIVPHVLGGPMTESNMVLFCRNCNSQNPETIYEEFFWLWIKGRRKLQEKYNRPYLAFPSQEQEYDLMFGFEDGTIEDRIEIKNKIEITLCFGAKECIRAGKKFLKQQSDTHLPRYPSSSAVIEYKFYKFLEYLFEKYKLNDPDSEISEWFPKLESFEIRRKFLYYNSDDEEEQDYDFFLYPEKYIDRSSENSLDNCPSTISLEPKSPPPISRNHKKTSILIKI